jgi:two-component system NtrC family sensor kinase
MSTPPPSAGRLWALPIPLLLLTLYAVCGGLYSLRQETRLAVRSAEEDTVRGVSEELALLQATLDTLLPQGGIAPTRELLARLASTPHLQVGLLLGGQGTVLASTQPLLLDKPAHEAWPELNQPENLARLQRARQQAKGIVEISSDRRRVIGYSPVRLGDPLASPQGGYLFLQHDLTERVDASRQKARGSVLRSTLTLLLLAAGMGLILHLVQGRRIRRLAVAAQDLVSQVPGTRRAGARPGEHGEDALGKLDQAFHQIAEQIGRSRERLEENEQRFQTLIERSPDAIFIHWESQIVFNNPAAATLLGYGQAMELQGRRITELLLPEDAPTLSEPSAEGVPREVRWLHRSGRQVLGEVVTFPLLFERQRVRVSIVRDITERKQLQEKLSSAERMASLGTLAAGVAHEINNPLSFMQSNVRFALEELSTVFMEPGSQWEERLREVQEALKETLEGSARVNDIVRDLKTFSRGDDGKRGPVDVHAVLNLCANIARSQLRHRARLVKEYGELPPLHASESRLAQLFLNLLINAAQAIPEGEDVNTHEVRITTRQEEGWVVVAIKDTGVGIPPEYLPRLFDPFFTTKPVGVGTGLGLSICHGIVTGLGGRITVESEPGRGSTFQVFLPVGGA